MFNKQKAINYVRYKSRFTEKNFLEADLNGANSFPRAHFKML